MIKRICITLAAVLLCAVCAAVEPQNATQAQPQLPALISGIDSQYFDNSIRAQDDFYQHVNGKWLATTEIPADKSSYGSFIALRDETLNQLRAIVEGLQPEANPPDPDRRKIADLYASFLDEAALEKLDAKPLEAEFARIEALHDKSDIASLLVRFHELESPLPSHRGFIWMRRSQPDTLSILVKAD